LFVDLVENYVKIERYVSSLIIIIIIMLNIYRLFSLYEYEHEDFGKFIPHASLPNKKWVRLCGKTSSDFGRLPLNY